MSSRECDDARNCTVGGVVKACFEEPTFTGETFFCDCSSWYGWTGDRCDQVSPQLIYARTTAIFWTISGAILSSYIIFNLIRWFFFADLKNNHKTNPIFVTGIFAALAAGSIVIFAALQITPLFDPTKFIVDEFLYFDIVIVGVATSYGAAIDIFLVLALSFYFLACLNISLSWMDAIDSVPFHKKTSLDKFAVQYRKFVFYFIGSYILLAFVCIAIGFYLVITLLAPFLCAVLMIFYVVGRIRILDALKISSSFDKDHAMRQIVSKVRFSSSLAIASLFGVAILSVVYRFLYDSKRFSEFNTEPGKLNKVMLCRDFITLACVVFIIHTARFVDSAYHRLLAHKTKNHTPVHLSIKSHTTGTGKRFDQQSRLHDTTADL